MAVELTVPQLGESITEAVISKWHKKVGDTVAADEPIVSLETDKVTVDVPAPSAGALETIGRKEGETVRVGEVLGAIGAGGAKSAPASSPAKAAPPEAAAPAVAAVPATSERGASLTPVARKLVEEKGLDPAKIQGSGPGGRILKEDVLSHVDGGTSRGSSTAAAVAPAPARAPSPAPAPSGPRPRADREERVRMTPLRRKVAERLLAAQSQAAILTTFNEVDMSGVMELRKRYQEQFTKRHGVKLGFMSFFVRAAVEALRAFPLVNAEIDGEDVVFKQYYDIGVAVQGSRGLVVPVLRDADAMSMADMEKQIGDFGTRARNDKLTLAELQGGTFTISNGGVFGSMLSTPILNPPQTAILGLHNIQERAVVRDGQIVARPMMYLALSYDHRLLDGRDAVSFLVRIKEGIEDPQRLLLEV